MNTIETLQKIQDSEINFQIKTFWDNGFMIQLGDNVNGIVVDEEIYSDSLQECVDQLVEKVLEHYPESRFAKEYSK